MNEILDDIDQEKQERRTQWFSVYCFSLVYALYSLIKWHLLDLLFKQFPSETLVFIFVTLVLILIAIEFCVSILLLRKRYLNNSNAHAFYTCIIYSLSANIFLAFNPFSMTLSSLPSPSALFFVVVLIIVISTPVSIVAIMMVNYVTVNYLDKK